MQQFLDPNFWFSQPPVILSRADMYLGYFFAGLLILSVIFWATAKFTKHTVIRKIWKRYQYLAVTIALSGLLWFGLRYENTPVFANRYWVGIVLLGGLVWKLFILKYLVFNFHAEKVEYDHEQLKNKYIPGKR